MNYTLGDPVFPPLELEDFCLDWHYFRPVHLSNNPDFCIGFGFGFGLSGLSGGSYNGTDSTGTDNNSSTDTGTGTGTGTPQSRQRQAILKPCHELDTLEEYFMYGRLDGTLESRGSDAMYCLEVAVQVGTEGSGEGQSKVGGSPITTGRCNSTKLEQKWYLHEDGRLQSLFDKSFITVAGGCEIVENGAAVVTSHDDGQGSSSSSSSGPGSGSGGCNQWLVSSNSRSSRPEISIIDTVP